MEKPGIQQQTDYVLHLKIQQINFLLEEAVFASVLQGDTNPTSKVQQRYLLSGAPQLAVTQHNQVLQRLT